jgi:hypothetical protein
MIAAEDEDCRGAQGGPIQNPRPNFVGAEFNHGVGRGNVVEFFGRV